MLQFARMVSYSTVETHNNYAVVSVRVNAYVTWARTTSQELIAMLNIKVDLVGNFGALGGLCALSAKESRDRNYDEGDRNSTKHDGIK